MKKFLVLSIAVLVLSVFAISAQDDPYTNKFAPSNYDANLKKGEKAVGVVVGSLEAFTIISKSGGIYLATEDSSGREYSLRANSVYPYFDIQKFGEIISGKEDLITPYLECYAKKRGTDFEQIKGDGFRPPDFGNADEMKEVLQKQQSELAKLEAKLKSLSARPDTFLDYSQNPAIWSEIAAKRAEYLPCVLGDKSAQDIAESPWLRAHRDGIKKVLSAVERYRAGSGDSMMSSSEYAFYAVSSKMRADWLKEKNALNFTDAVDQMLKPLAAALAEKLLAYFPNTEKYAVRNPAEEALLKSVLPNPARQKIFKIGLAQSAWQIDKGTLGIPQARYKNGLIYRRDLQADHPYCYATYVNVIQNYAGGGTYAASRSEIIREELAACPAGN